MYDYYFRLFLISLLPFGLPVSNPSSIDASSIQPLPTLKPLPSNIQSKNIQPKLPYIIKPAYEDASFCAKTDCSHYGSCLSCTFPDDCEYGSIVMVNCTTIAKFCKKLEQTVVKEAVCRYCYQTDEIDHDCDEVRNCSSSSVQLFPTTCRVHQNVICMGRRQFLKNVRCRWTNGYSWSKAMLLSVTLGGFGADRFYLGLWKSAIGKLFSFGGLGIWTLLDLLLIGVGYIQPADQSSYI